MQFLRQSGLIILLLACPMASAKNGEHQWNIGRVLDENRARYFAGMLHDSSSQSTNSGSWDGSANSTSIGDTTNTQASGTYSGTTSTSTSGYSIPVYRVYDYLMIEGDQSVYVTSERIRWRWSKSVRVAVNGTVRYYVDGRKLHVLDDDNKEHTVEVLKEIRKIPFSGGAAPTGASGANGAGVTQAQNGISAQASLTIESSPPGADITVDGGFVGNTPSTVTVAPGSHEISVTKKGLAPWTRKLNVTGGSIHLSAELEQQAPR